MRRRSLKRIKKEFSKNWPRPKTYITCSRTSRKSPTIQKQKIFLNKNTIDTKKPTMSAFTSTRKTVALNLPVKTLLNRLSDSQPKSNKSTRKEPTLIAIRRTSLHIFSPFGPLSRVVPMKTTKFNLSISRIQHRFFQFFCCLVWMPLRRRTRKSKNAWCKYQQARVNLWF